LYDRRRPDCGYCGAAIPEDLRLTEAQAGAFEDERDQKGRGMERFTRMLDSCCDHVNPHSISAPAMPVRAASRQRREI
jgi:hypothetical protein